MEMPDPKPLTLSTELLKRKENRKKSTYQRIRSQNHHYQTHYQANLIRLVTENIENQKSNYAIKVKTIGSARKSTRQNHC